LSEPEEPAISQLTIEELQSVCLAIEKAVRSFVLSKVAAPLVDDLNIVVGVEGQQPVSVDVDVDIRLSPVLRDICLDDLLEAAIDQGFEAGEETAKEILACRSREH